MSRPRRVFPAAESEQRMKSVIVTPTGDSGKAPPARTPLVRTFPGQRTKMPPVDEAKPEELDVPAKADSPVKKPMPAPSGDESHDDFVTRCMDDEVMAADYPDGKQRYAVCEAQWKDKAEKADDKTVNEDSVDSEAMKAHETSVMVALHVPDAISKSLVIDDSYPAHEMHLTLCLCGNVSKAVEPAQLEKFARGMAAYCRKSKPMVGYIGGLGRFCATEYSDNKDVLVALADIPALPEFRQDIVKMAEDCGMTVKRNHGYTPHITMSYIDADADAPLKQLKRQEVTFDKLMLHVGEDKVAYHLGEDNIHKALYCPIVKADDDKRLVTGIVLQPEVVDAQGDIISEDVILQAAHAFLANYNRATQLGLQHREFPPGLSLVESWVAPVDLVLAGKDILKGTWMMTVHVANDQIWSAVKTGGIRGFSIGGMAKVQRLRD